MKTKSLPRKAILRAPGLKRALAALFLFTAGIFILKASASAVLKHEAAALISEVTGAHVSIADVQWDSFSEARLEKIRALNSSGFFQWTFVYIPEARISFDLTKIFQGKTHLKLVRLGSAELHLEKNQNGVTNVHFLKFVKNPPAPSNGRFYVEHFEVGPLYVHYEEPHDKLAKNFSVYARAGEKSFSGLREPSMMVTILLKKALQDTAIGAYLFDYQVEQDRIVRASKNTP